MSKSGANLKNASRRIGGLLVTSVADVPAEVLPSVLRALRRAEPYTPRWLRELRVTFPTHLEQGELEKCLEVRIALEYERAEFRVFPMWLDKDGERQYEAVVHEFGHLLQAPIRDALCTALDALVPSEGALRSLLIERTRAAGEQSAEDIKHAILAAERRASRVKVNIR